jgi:SAM-dependent methyltransferase
LSGGFSRGVPWQLQMFDKSLKKRQKVALLLDLLGPLAGERCLLLTNGDNNGAMNYHFRAAGGRWTWADMEESSVSAIGQLLNDPVSLVTPEHLPFASASFDRVVVIDVHEHLSAVDALNREIARLLAPNGVVVVTTPNGDRRLPVARLKMWIGMRPEEYGHVVQGYQRHELEAMLRAQGLAPERAGAYSRFFTELAELSINFAYVKVLARRRPAGEVRQGEIAPDSEAKLGKMEKSYRVYKRIYPAMRLFSSLDRLIPGEGGYAVAVAARKRA